MSRSRVNSHFEHFTRPLSLQLTSLPAPEAQDSQLSTSENLSVASESTEKLHSLLVSLQPPASQDAVDHAIEYLVDRSGDLHVADSQETALKNAVIGQAAVGLYAQALDIYLNEATDIESEAEWWANVERSRVGVAWFLLQTLPSRMVHAFRTVVRAIHDQGLPLRASLLTPSSLFRLLPATALHPSALTSSFFPHLKHDQSFSSLLWIPPRPSSRTLTQCLRSLWSAVLLPFSLAREECRYKRRELEKLRDERAEELGRLAQLRISAGSGPHAGQLPSQLLSCFSGEPSLSQNDAENIQRVSSSLLPAHIAQHASATGQFRRPSRLVLLWPRLLLFPPIALYTLRTLYASRASIMELAIDTKETVEGFAKNSLIDPLKEVLRTVRTGGEDGVIVRREGVVADLDSLERMALALARDQLHYNSSQLAALSQQIKLGDLTPVLQLYEEDIKTPVKSMLTGSLLRSMFIQVQKAKVDIDQALSGIDKLLKSQELTFAFVGLAPALVIVSLIGNYVSRTWTGGKGDGRFGGKARRTGAWTAMRRIERLLVLQPRVGFSASTSLTPLTTGLLLISVTRLRTYAETNLPKGSRLREGFLQDVEDLEDPAMPREEKLRVVERMWRSWGGILGWGKVGGEGIFGQ